MNRHELKWAERQVPSGPKILNFGDDFMTLGYVILADGWNEARVGGGLVGIAERVETAKGLVELAVLGDLEEKVEQLGRWRDARRAVEEDLGGECGVSKYRNKRREANK